MVNSTVFIFSAGIFWNIYQNISARWSNTTEFLWFVLVNLSTGIFTCSLCSTFCSHFFPTHFVSLPVLSPPCTWLFQWKKRWAAIDVSFHKLCNGCHLHFLLFPCEETKSNITAIIKWFTIPYNCQCSHLHRDFIFHDSTFQFLHPKLANHNSMKQSPWNSPWSISLNDTCILTSWHELCPVQLPNTYSSTYPTSFA